MKRYDQKETVPGARASRRPRCDKGSPRWTERDNYCFEWIGDQRAIRYDQLQHLLARESEGETQMPGRLSASRTTKIIRRWEQRGLVIYAGTSVQRPGWLWLTRKGLRHAELDYRYSEPRESTLTHLYYINQARLLFEDEFDDNEMEWISERALLANQERRRNGEQLHHVPDALIVFRAGQKLELEVELSRKKPRELYAILRGGDSALEEVHPVRYYVAPCAKNGLIRAYRALMSTYDTFREFIDIRDLKELE